MSSVIAISDSPPAPAQGPQGAAQVTLTTPSDRRADIDAKHQRLAALLEEVKCEGLLLLEPENFSWLTAGGSVRGVIDAAALPALYFSPEGRWLISSNVD